MAFIHFRQRLKERYGLKINFDEYLDLHDAERVGVKKEKIGKQKRTLSLMNFKGRTIYVVYGYTNKTCSLVTVLPYNNTGLRKLYYPNLAEALKEISNQLIKF